MWDSHIEGVGKSIVSEGGKDRWMQLEQCTNMEFIMDKRMGGHNLNCVCLDMDFYQEMVNATATMNGL